MIKICYRLSHCMGLPFPCQAIVVICWEIMFLTELFISQTAAISLASMMHFRFRLVSFTRCVVFVTSGNMTPFGSNLRMITRD